MFEDIAKLLGLNPEFEKEYFVHNTHYRTKYGSHSEYCRLKFFESGNKFYKMLPNVPELIPGKREPEYCDFLTMDHPTQMIYNEFVTELYNYPTIDDLM